MLCSVKKRDLEKRMQGILRVLWEHKMALLIQILMIKLVDQLRSSLTTLSLIRFLILFLIFSLLFSLILPFFSCQTLAQINLNFFKKKFPIAHIKFIYQARPLAIYIA